MKDFELSPEVSGSLYTETVPERKVARSPKPRSCEYLYFDLETIPDFERLKQLGIAPPPVQNVTACDDIRDLGWSSVPDFKAILTTHNPDKEWLAEAAACEKKGKDRAGVHSAISAAMKKHQSAGSQDKQFEKICSTTPELCKIIAVSVKTSQANSSWSRCPKPTGTAPKDEELSLIEDLWDSLAEADTAVGYNCLAFDFPVLLFRSAFYAIDPPRRFDIRKYGSRDVLDLYQVLSNNRQWPPGMGIGKLSTQLRLCGLGSAQSDKRMDGSKVLDAWRSGKYAEIEDYVAGDAMDLELLHRFYRGYYWD